MNEWRGQEKCGVELEGYHLFKALAKNFVPCECGKVFSLLCVLCMILVVGALPSS